LESENDGSTVDDVENANVVPVVVEIDSEKVVPNEDEVESEKAGSTEVKLESANVSPIEVNGKDGNVVPNEEMVGPLRWKWRKIKLGPLSKMKVMLLVKKKVLV
jgi:hypothetical protein